MNFNGTLCRQDNSQRDSEIWHRETLGSKNKFDLLMRWNIPQYRTGGGRLQSNCAGARGAAREITEHTRAQDGNNSGWWLEGGFKHRELPSSFSLELPPHPKLEELFIQLVLEAASGLQGGLQPIFHMG